MQNSEKPFRSAPRCGAERSGGSAIGSGGSIRFWESQNCLITNNSDCFLLLGVDFTGGQLASAKATFNVSFNFQRNQQLYGQGEISWQDGQVTLSLPPVVR